MYSGSTLWIWQQAAWPDFHWQEVALQPLLRELHRTLGVLLGRAGSHVETASPQAQLDTLLQNIITSSAIEGEQLNAFSVRSSLARRLGVAANDTLEYPVTDRTEGLAELMMDAVGNLAVPLTAQRLYQWHRWLFPAAEQSLVRIRVGELRGEEPMQVVSGRIDRPHVHFEAPPRQGLEAGLQQFLNWFEQSRQQPELDPLLRAGIAHLWFITLHPFDDGNGRLVRAITDLALAQSDAQTIRLYAMSASILDQRKGYYTILEQSQRGDMDITDWLCWFLQALQDALAQALTQVDRVLMKSRFWQQFRDQPLMPSQIKVLNRLLEGGEDNFPQGISAAQYQKVAKVSKATATRHLVALVACGCLEKLAGGGRSTRYQISVNSVRNGM